MAAVVVIMAVTAEQNIEVPAEAQVVGQHRQVKV
jgi:hypothetical protein